jgi:uncharacterized protein with HEPN domain
LHPAEFSKRRDLLVPADTGDARAIEHLIGGCRKLDALIDGTSEAGLKESWQLASAACWQIVILGEATRRLSLSFQEENPQIPWASIRGMRNRLIHNFDSINLTEVWRTASRDVPVLLVRLLSLEELG